MTGIILMLLSPRATILITQMRWIQPDWSQMWSV